jgi:RNA polymerase sigma factor (sigma-70 family)
VESEREAEASFTRWAAGRQLPLLRTAVLLTGDHQRAEDLVQDALTKVAVRWRRLRDGNPDAYARQVIVRTNISWWRKHRREVVTDAGAAMTTHGGERAVDRRLMLDHALDALTARQRAALRRLRAAAPELALLLEEEVS